MDERAAFSKKRPTNSLSSWRTFARSGTAKVFPQRNYGKTLEVEDCPTYGVGAGLVVVVVSVVVSGVAAGDMVVVVVVVLLSALGVADGFTMVVLFSVLVIGASVGDAAGATVSVFCSQAARRAAPARIEIYFFMMF